MREGHRMACWYCNCVLENCLQDDNIWVEYAKWFRNCDFLLLLKGFGFLVSHVRYRFSASFAINNFSIFSFDCNVLHSATVEDVFHLKFVTIKNNSILLPYHHGREP